MNDESQEIEGIFCQDKEYVWRSKVSYQNDINFDFRGTVCDNVELAEMR
jgi:hypothetical protein